MSGTSGEREGVKRTERWYKAVDLLVPYIEDFWRFVDGEITEDEFKGNFPVRVDREVGEATIQERIEVRLSPSFGWCWRIDGHEHNLLCTDPLGPVTCDFGGWRPTRAWAVRAGMRAARRKDRWVRRVKRDWEAPHE